MSGSSPSFEPALEDLRWLRALAARLVRDPHTADDAVQETLAAALARGSPRERPPRGWLAAVLQNALRQEWRGRARRAKREAGAVRAQNGRSTLEVVEELALHRRLVEQVHALDEPYRTAILLHYLRGESAEEIARARSLPVKTIRTHLERGLARLRARMGRDREAWAALLLFPRAVPLAPALTALLLPMNLKAIAALLGLLLVGAFFYLRGAASRAEHDAVAQALAPEPAPDEPPSAPVATSPARESAAPEPVERAASAMTDRAPAPTPLPLLVHGFVRALDGRSLPGLEIVFERRVERRYEALADAPRVTSGPDGAFALPLPALAGRLNVAADDHVALVRPVLDGAAPLDEAVVVAAPRRTYAGVVVDPSGAPIAHARVEITLAGSFVQSLDVGGAAVHLLLPFAETTCDAEGRFRFERAGFVERAHLAAGADGWAAGRFELPPLSDEFLELVLAPATSGPRTIFGRVVDAAGASAAGAQVSSGGPSVASDADGRFTLECEPWREQGWLRAVKPGALPAERALADALDERSTPERPLVLQLGASPRSIRGRLLDVDGAPVAGAAVWTPDTTAFGSVVQQDGENSFLGQTTVEAVLTGRMGPWESPVHATTDADGEFELAGVLARPYAVFALDPRTLDGLGPVELQGGEEHAVLTLVRAPTTPVAGRVVSRRGAPLAGVRVSIGRRFAWNPDDARDRQVVDFPLRSPSAGWSFSDAAVVTDAEGRFAFPPLVPAGAYLALRGKALVLGASFELDGAADLAALEVAVDASSRFRIELARAAEADEFSLANPAGELEPLFIEVDGGTISAPRATLDAGRSGMILTEEGEHTVVLHLAGNEIRRATLFFPAGGLHELRP